jgi:DNA repair protein RadC
MYVLNEIKLKYKPILTHDVKFDQAEIVVKYLRPKVDKNYISEESFAIYLNRANNPIGFQKLGTGTISSCVIDLQLVCASALLTRSSGIILCHTHPSGNLTPSEPDLKVTKQIKNALELFGITLFDHIILTPGSFNSLQSSGLI